MCHLMRENGLMWVALVSKLDVKSGVWAQTVKGRCSNTKLVVVFFLSFDKYFHLQPPILCYMLFYIYI